MATDVVQFRFDAETLDFLRSQGFNANQVAREAFAREMRRMRAQAQVERLGATGARWSAPPEQLVRSLRDGRAL